MPAVPKTKPAAKRKPAARPATAPAAAAATTGRTIDLDAARAARAEAGAESVTLKFGGVAFTLPPEMPADFAMHAADGRLRDGVAALLGESADAFFALRPTMPDIMELVTVAGDVYGITPGE